MLKSEADEDKRELDARISFHAPHLERVSRSFAFGISRLQGRLRASVGLGYLICRLLDTVEDAQWDTGLQQEHAFTEFNEFCTAQVIDPLRVRAWAELFPATIPSGERMLLDDAAKVFAEFSSLRSDERAAMLNPVLSMSRGMFAYTSRARRSGEMRLRNLTDANVYCFFVAGVVGELLTGLVEVEMRPIGLNQVWELAIHFGLFLQKINVLKDQHGDEREGRYLVPSREAMLSSLRDDALGAFDYLLAIPVSRKDYRLFCAWGLFLGLATVPLLREGLEAPKISRLQALAIGAKIELAISDKDRLRSLFEGLVAEGWPGTERGAGTVVGPGTGEALALLEANYVGRLNQAQLSKLLEA